jgi:electron transport complex protein RnfA
MGAYFTLFIGAVLINNFVLTKFLGLCIFFGVSKNLNASVGMGFAVTSVITLSTILAWLLYTQVSFRFIWNSCVRFRSSF